MDFFVSLYEEGLATLALLLTAGSVLKKTTEWKLLPVSVLEVSK